MQLRETAEHFLFHCTKYQHIRKVTVESASPSFRTLLLKIYCLSLYLAQNVLYNNCYQPHLHLTSPLIVSTSEFTVVLRLIEVFSLICLHCEVTTLSSFYQDHTRCATGRHHRSTTTTTKLFMLQMCFDVLLITEICRNWICGKFAYPCPYGRH